MAKCRSLPVCLIGPSLKSSADCRFILVGCAIEAEKYGSMLGLTFTDACCSIWSNEHDTTRSRLKPGVCEFAMLFAMTSCFMDWATIPLAAVCNALIIIVSYALIDR
jgi:hypothetical protein